MFEFLVAFGVYFLEPILIYDPKAQAASTPQEKEGGGADAQPRFVASGVKVNNSLYGCQEKQLSI